MPSPPDGRAGEGSLAPAAGLGLLHGAAAIPPAQKMPPYSDDADHEWKEEPVHMVAGRKVRCGTREEVVNGRDAQTHREALMALGWKRSVENNDSRASHEHLFVRAHGRPVVIPAHGRALAGADGVVRSDRFPVTEPDT